MNVVELLANENVPAPLVRLLRQRGLVVHAVGELMPRASDTAVLTHAATVTALLTDAELLKGHLVVVDGRRIRRRLMPPP